MATNPVSDDRVQIHPAEHPSASLRTESGRWVRIHSGRDPVAEADQFVESSLGGLPGGSPGVVFVIGPGLGYTLEAIERRAPGTRIIAIEPFPAIARGLLERRDWQEWIERKQLTLLVGPDYRGAAEIGRTLNERITSAATVIEHPVYKREFAREAAAARAVADRVLEGARLNAEARRHFAGRYLLNTLKNLPAILEEGDAASLHNAFAGVPALVVAAGPSLDDNIPYIKALQDRVLIVAVDTTLRPLRAAGIRPHVVVAVDPSEANARHLLALDDTEDSWLVSEGSIDPRVFPRFAGRVFSFKVSNHQPWPWLREHGFDRGTLRAWGSVLTTAFDLALDMGCEPIVFVGADLSFPNGVHYCRGTMNEAPENHDASEAARAAGFAEALRLKKAATCETPDIAGAPVTSTVQFIQFRDWLVSRAIEAAPRQILNATGAGILHGEAIGQAQLKTLAIADAKTDVGSRLRDSWNESSAKRRETAAAVEAALTTRAGSRLPREAWAEFVIDEVWAARVLEFVDARWRTAAVIASHPSSLVRIQGGAVTFTADVAGGPSPALQWQVSADSGVSWQDVPGATGVSLTVVADPRDAGCLFRIAAENMDGRVTSRPAALSVLSGGIVHDFNGDGRADVLWRDAATGENEVWYLDGSVRTGGGALMPVPDPLWALPVAGDLNGDGHVDLVWRYHNGNMTLWHLDGLERTGWSTFEEGDTAWQVVAAGDFNGDGRSDLVWHNVLNGELTIRQMNGTCPIGTTSIGAEADLRWVPVAAGDIDGDGRPELVWRHSVTGANRAWFIENGRHTKTVALEPETDLSWQIVGAGDFDGDGRAELLWRHAAAGELRIVSADGRVHQP